MVTKWQTRTEEGNLEQSEYARLLKNKTRVQAEARTRVFDRMNGTTGRDFQPAASEHRIRELKSPHYSCSGS